MMIIDSLLMSSSFSLGEVRRTLSLFSGGSSTRSKGIGNQVHRAQLGSVVGLMGVEQAKKSRQQFPHDRHDCLQASFAAS